MSSPSGNLLREFKGDLRAPLPLHPLEKALIVVVALNVCALPWMLGGMRPWAQLISLGLAVVAFALALVPRRYEGDYVHGDSYRLYPHRKLIRWPIWWIGLVFFGYVLIQALNPAWEFVQLENSWGMKRIEHIEWLPTGMRTPFEMMNPWRQMMIWGAPFLLACALWAGFTRRKSVITLLTAIVINATALAIVGIVARYTEPTKILWLVKGLPAYCFSSFIYKNHAGSFFALSVGLSLSLAIWHQTQAVRHLKRSSPAGFFVVTAFPLLLAVLLTYSRAAILITGVFLLLSTIIGGVRLLGRVTARQAPLVLATFFLGTVTLIGVGSKLVNSERILNRIISLTDAEQTDRSVVARQIAWQAGMDMSEERPNLGWGAGGFRFLFPRYQAEYPEITKIKIWNTWHFTFWEHAHNDYLQLLIEAGRVGIGLMAAASVFALASFTRHRGWRNTGAVTLIGACLIVMAHATLDFPLQNPAILTTLFAVAAAALILPGFENRRA
jgi:O-antigen ligase